MWRSGWFPLRRLWPTADAGVIDIAGRPAPARPPPGLLLDGQVPHVPGLVAMQPQHLFLLRRRAQAVADSHEQNVASGTDKPPGQLRPERRNLRPAYLDHPGR
jgi:hypothetical protein